MKLKRLLLFLYVLVSIGLCGPVRGSVETKTVGSLDFLEGIRHYEAKAYPEAVAAFEKILATGVRNGKLYYNMGNACLKTGDLGAAILWYERALELIPHDPDLRFNLAHAAGQVKDEREGDVSSIFRILFFWKDILPIETLQWTGIYLNAAFWLLLGLYRFAGKGVLLKIGYGVLILSVLFLGTAGWRLTEKALWPQAVILPQSIAVRSGQTTDSTELFVLHAGTKVAVKKQTEGFLKIRFSEDKIGWIPAGSAGII